MQKNCSKNYSNIEKVFQLKYIFISYIFILFIFFYNEFSRSYDALHRSLNMPRAAQTIMLSLEMYNAPILICYISYYSPSKWPDMNPQGPVGTIDLLTSVGTEYLFDLGSNHGGIRPRWWTITPSCQESHLLFLPTKGGQMRLLSWWWGRWIIIILLRSIIFISFCGSTNHSITERLIVFEICSKMAVMKHPGGRSVQNWGLNLKHGVISPK